MISAMHLQVAVCCSVLLCFAVNDLCYAFTGCSVLQGAAVYSSLLQSAAVCCSLLQSVAL